MSWLCAHFLELFRVAVRLTIKPLPNSLKPNQPLWLTGWQLGEATRRARDARLLRKSVENDLNQLELQLLQGDPVLQAIQAGEAAAPELTGVFVCYHL